MRTSHTRPFTLIEILVVMGIITILAAIVVGGVSVARRKSFDAATRAVMEKCAAALQNYRARFGYFPPPVGAPGYSGNTGYLSNSVLVGVPSSEVRTVDSDGDGIPEIADGRGKPLRYRCPGAHNPASYDLWSTGANGTDENGGGDDIANWKQE